jgi:hypothetical protein
MTDRWRIGIDLDNTLIDYEAVFCAFARDRGLVPTDFVGSKDDIRAKARSTPDGDIAWQRLQGAVYSRGIRQAVLFEGADDFLCRARDQRREIVIVSHKTEFGHFDPDRVNLRSAALSWLEQQGFFREDGFAIPAQNVVFAATRSEKIAAIRELGLRFFIDDLPEVLEDRAFPPEVTGILFARRPDLSTYPRAFALWQEIAKMVFG